jgi:transposase
LPLALSAPRQLSAALDLYNIFTKFQRDGVWEAIWAELHMALRERMGREGSPSAAVLDSQSVKSAEEGAAKTTKWVTTPASR